MKLLSLLKFSLIFGLTYLIVGGFIFLIFGKSNTVSFPLGLLGYMIIQPTDAFLELGIPLPLSNWILFYGFMLPFGANGNLYYYFNNIVFYFILGLLIDLIRASLRRQNIRKQF